MRRSQFIKSTVLGLGVFSTGFIGNAFNHGARSIKASQNTKPKVLKNGEGAKQIVLGDHQTLKLTGKDTNGQYTLIEQYNDPGMEIPLHIHQDEDEIFHVLEGELEIQIGNDIKLLKAGDIGFCPRGIPHSWKVVGNSKAKVMLSVFPSGLELMFGEIATLPPGPPDFKNLSKICEKYNIRFV